MIFTEKQITINNNQCKIDSPVVLYRGDYNVEVRFTIVSSPYKYSNKQETNVIEQTEASYGQLVIKTPGDKPAIFSDITQTKRGAITFTIASAMIDEISEVGNYTFQIRLLDENKQSRATIPEVKNGIEIREPIASEDVSTTNEVGIATVGYALTTAGTTEDAFDSQGNYNKTTWGTGDRITDAKLNKIEAGIDGVNKKVASGGTGSNNAGDISIADTGNYFTSTNVEGALQEAGSQIKEIVNVADLAQEGNNVYIKDSNGNKVGNGITISSSSSSSSEITKDFINSNKYKLTWLGERFTAPSDYVAWGGSMRYEPRLGKFVQWLYCAPAHLHNTAKLYVVYIDKNTLVADEPIHCVYYDTDGSTQLNFDNEAGVTVRCLEDGTYQLIKNIKEGTADIKYRFNSTDYGKTWVKGERITPPSGVSGFDDIVTLSNGRLITSYGGPIFYSDDGGVNWTISTPATAGGNYEAEANFLELKPGVVMAIARYSMSGGTAGDGTPDSAIIAYSYDYGTTWTPWQLSTSILDMNAIGCKGIMHDGFVELFVCSRWYDGINNYIETGKRGAIYHYVARVDDALNDNFTNLGIIHYFDNSPQEVMAPDFAIDDNNEMLFSQACGGGSVTCTKFYAKGTKTNYFSLIDDTNKSNFTSYSNLKVDKLIDSLNAKILELQYALSQIPGSGVEEPTPDSGFVIWTKKSQASDDILLTDESNPFKEFLAKRVWYANVACSITNDTLGNKVFKYSNGHIFIPATRSNFAFEIKETIEANSSDWGLMKNLALVYDDITNYKNLGVYSKNVYIGTTKGSIESIKENLSEPYIVTRKIVREGDKILITVYIDDTLIIENKDITSIDCGVYGNYINFPGIYLSTELGKGAYIHYIKYGEWGDNLTYYSLTNTLTNCDTSNKTGFVFKDNAYTSIITANSGYQLDTVTITMGGNDITSTVYSNGEINIPNVTGDIVITASAISS